MAYESEKDVLGVIVDEKLELVKTDQHGLDGLPRVNVTFVLYFRANDKVHKF